MICSCRNCGKHYPENKTRAELKGYCSMACQHEKAHRLGYRPPRKHYDRRGAPITKNYGGRTEYDVLIKAKQVGSLPIPEDLLPEKPHHRY